MLHEPNPSNDLPRLSHPFGSGCAVYAVRVPRRATARRSAFSRGMLLALAAAAMLACSRDDNDSHALAQSARPAERVDTLVLAPGSRPYRAVDVGAIGRISGTVEIAGEAPSDTLVHPTSDEHVCGQQLVDLTIDRDGPRLGGVVVWLHDARAGKRLPLERRYEITNEQCRLEPRVQAALAGGTLNVRSADPLVHRTRFTRTATGSVPALVSTNDAGQVVPREEILARPGRLRVSCDLHPWTRGWIFAFDHPYFAVTSRGGTFTLDSVPVGRYRLVAWHERFGLSEHDVEVRVAEQGDVEVRIRY